MHLRDTTMEANSAANMEQYYLYHSESSNGRWSLAVEQPTPESFSVSVLYKEPDWDVSGVIRYWVFGERAEAEARYLELQKLFEGLEETETLKSMPKRLPPTERHWGEQE